MKIKIDFWQGIKPQKIDKIFWAIIILTFTSATNLLFTPTLTLTILNLLQTLWLLTMLTSINKYKKMSDELK